MASNVTLRLEVLDVYGKPIAEKVDVMLRHRVLSQIKKKSASGSHKIDVPGLFGDPQGAYRLDVDAPSYQFVSDFITMKSSGITPLTYSLPIDPDKVKGVKFGAFSSLTASAVTLLEASENVLSFVGKKGKALYDALEDDPIRLTFRNLESCAATVSTRWSARNCVKRLKTASIKVSLMLLTGACTIHLRVSLLPKVSKHPTAMEICN
jgi:hypothetical protein